MKTLYFHFDTWHSPLILRIPMFPLEEQLDGRILHQSERSYGLVSSSQVYIQLCSEFRGVLKPAKSAKEGKLDRSKGKASWRHLRSPRKRRFRLVRFSLLEQSSVRKLHRESPTSFGGVRLRSGGKQERSSQEGRRATKEIAWDCCQRGCTWRCPLLLLFSGKGSKHYHLENMFKEFLPQHLCNIYYLLPVIICDSHCSFLMATGDVKHSSMLTERKEEEMTFAHTTAELRSRSALSRDSPDQPNVKCCCSRRRLRRRVSSARQIGSR